MIIPSWFEKDLKNIDSSYRAEVETGLVCIIKDVDISVPLADGRVLHVKGPRTIDVFDHANDAALERLRERKYMGRKLKIIEDPMNELRWLKGQQDAANEKRKQLAIDMMAEGLKEIDMIENKRKVSFVMPGDKHGE